MLYKVIKPSILIGDRTIVYGETFDPSIDETRDWAMLVRFKQIEKVNNPAEIAAEVEKREPKEEFTPKDMKLIPKIEKKAYGWYVVTVNGEEIGTKTRDKKEAQRIADEWSAAN